ncbi:hypothetical protein DL93DRAFT_2058184 [Clavulina sp. PMI_390]|nr:hypothetical protein DL93DRAFT_2058184 [Clavulina sp. PMI_390]
MKQRVDARKSRVGDKIKKRMSMRYADISDPVGIPDVPAMPTQEEILDYDNSNAGAGIRIGARAAITIDKEAMQQERFDPDACSYCKTLLSEADLKQLQSILAHAKTDASNDLQRSVFQNYEEFVMISKEISTLENDMLELKEGLSEWKNMPSLLSLDDSSSAAADRRRANRSSVADLTKLYATQMATLHSTIEGSAKFLPPLPGRHVVTEIENMWSLNAATYKVEYAVHFVLLDDSLLVAKRRKKRTGEGGKLVAERCWNLGDINVVDVKDSPDVTRAFRVRRGRDNYVFRCEKSSDKKAFLSTYKGIAEEYSARRRKEREGEHERRRSMWTSDDPTQRMSIVGDLPPMPPLPGAGPSSATGGAQAKVEEDARWIGEFTDELAVAVALRNWVPALDLIDQGKQRLATTPSLGPKLSTLTNSLVASLLHALSDPSIRKTSVVTYTSHLIRLGQSNAARDAFLRARTDLVKKRARMIGFEGEVSHYITELAIVIFTSIKHTAEWYLASFKENDMASGFIQWTTEQLELFASLFKRQLDGQADPHDLEESLKAMRIQSKRLLHDNNLDFTYLLESLLSDTISTAPQSVLMAPSITSSSTSTITPAISLSSSTFSRPALAPLSPQRGAAGLAGRTPSVPRAPRSPAPPPRSRDRPPSAAGRI